MNEKVYQLGKSTVLNELDVAITIPLSGKHIFISDLHIGDGVSKYDDFKKNRPLARHIISHYKHHNYTWVGSEITELLETSWRKIWDDASNRLFLRQLHKMTGVWMPGNHSVNVAEHIRCVFKDDGFRFSQSVKLGDSAIITHGHQFDWWNYKPRRFVRFLVGKVWTTLQIIGVRSDPPFETAYRDDKKCVLEEMYCRFAQEIDKTVITGHTHKPKVIEINDNIRYINTGSWVHQEGLTLVEQSGNYFALVLWKPDCTATTLYEGYIKK